MTRFATLAARLEFPEGPSVASDGAIWVSELKAGRIARIDEEGWIRRFLVGGAPNGTAFAPDGSLWFCDQGLNAVRRLDPSSGEVETIVDAIDGRSLDAPNDLAFAANGSVVFSCPGSSRRDPTGYLCRRDPDGTIERVADGLLFPNGVCISPDGDRLIVAETYGCRVSAGAWRPDGPIALDVMVDTPGPIGADGVAVTVDGSIATCVHGAGFVRLLGAGGTIVDVPVPDARPAGCAVDPCSRWSLIVTGTERGVVLGIDP